MTLQTAEFERWTTMREGQYLERKSAFERPGGGKPKPRHPKAVAKDVAETLAAMANADGGELVVGIEDDGTPTGLPFSENGIDLLLRAAGEQNYVHPPLHPQARRVETAAGLLILHFSVDWSPQVHQLADGRYVLRVNDQNAPFPADKIAALKATKAEALQERSVPPDASLEDVSPGMVATLGNRLGQPWTTEQVLLGSRLGEQREGRVVPNLMGLLVLGIDPLHWHPRCGIDFIRWEGTERRTGSNLNIVKRETIEQPLAILIEKAYEVIRPHIRQRQQLEGLLFSERLEYPTFVWQEALVNAVAHRDYSIRGASIEVSMFDDRLEIRSPGLPPHPVTVDDLNRRERVHLSRNPILMRVLTHLGFVRDLGEGIPRMFEEMEREGFFAPTFRTVAGLSFEVALRNEPVYDQETLTWLSTLIEVDLSGDQKRLLANAHSHDDRFTSHAYQRLANVDLYTASNSIKDLIRKGVVRSTGKGSRVYEVVGTGEHHPAAWPTEVLRIVDLLRAQDSISNQDVQRVLGLERKAAARLLDRLVLNRWVERTGSGRGTRYVAGARFHEYVSSPL